MADASATESLYWRRMLLLGAFLAVFVLGVVGYKNLHQLDDFPDTLSLPEACYRSLRLFTLNVDLPDTTQAPWYLWVAAVAAPLLVARAVVGLFRRQLAEVWVRLRARPRLVVFGAGEAGTRLARAAAAEFRSESSRWRRRRNVVVVIDADPQALTDLNRRPIYAIAGDGTATATLLRAGVGRAREVAVVTGDTRYNSAIVSALRGVSPQDCAVHVEVGDPGLAGTLEQGGVRTGVTVTSFNAATLATAELFDEPGAPPTNGAILLFGTGPLIDALIIELYLRQRIRLLDNATAEPPRLAVFGPDAVPRCRALARLMGTELQVLDLDPIDIGLDQAVELTVDTARHLLRYGSQPHVVVAVPTDLDGGGITITLARHFGPDQAITLITESPDNPFAAAIVTQTNQRADALAQVRHYSVPERAYTLHALRNNREVARLARAMRQPEGEARDLLERLEACGAPLRRSTLVPVAAAEKPLLNALEVTDLAALVRAGLRVDFTTPAALAAAAATLEKDGGQNAAFPAWCEAARHLRRGSLTPLPPVGSDAARLLDLRRAARTDEAAPSAARVVLLLGDLNRPTARTLLPSAIDGLADPPEIFAARHSGLGTTDTPVRPLPGDGAIRTRLLDLWTDWSSAAADVRVLLLPGAGTDEILLCRALGAIIGWPQIDGQDDLGRTLLNGATGLVPLPVDPMTIRAFLHPSRWPEDLAVLRDALAESLHRRYVDRQRGDRKPEGDPALRPWSALSPWFQDSNRAVVDDIPNKLAFTGLELTAGVNLTTVWPTPVDADQLEQLAEMEHGRFTAERLTSGWAQASRDPGRFLSPHLVPWTELADDIKDYDRETIDALPGVLAEHDIGLRPATDHPR